MQAVSGGRERNVASDQEYNLALLHRASGGDQEAFGLLYDHCAPEVLGLLSRILRCQSLAEEVLQEVFLQAWRELPFYRPDVKTVMAWLLMMARSRGHERLRRECSSLPLDTFPGSDASQEISSSGTALPEGRERRRGLPWALADLPDEQRVCIELALYEGLTHTEISTRLGVPLEAVKLRLCLGMMKIRESHAKGTPWVASRRSDRLGADQAGRPGGVLRVV